MTIIDHIQNFTGNKICKYCLADQNYFGAKAF